MQTPLFVFDEPPAADATSFLATIEAYRNGAAITIDSYKITSDMPLGSTPGGGAASPISR